LPVSSILHYFLFYPPFCVSFPHYFSFIVQVGWSSDTAVLNSGAISFYWYTNFPNWDF
jgi:hypothetical protein